MSINSILSAGFPGLQTAQTQLRAISDNIANIDTKGYVRKLVDQEPLVYGGVSGGVGVSGVRLAADQFLQQAGLKATADASPRGRLSLWDQAQSLPATRPVRTTSSPASTRLSPPSPPWRPTRARRRRGRPRSASSTRCFPTRSIGSQIDTFGKQADVQITADVDMVNRILARIDSLNAEATRAKLQGGDATGPESQQMQLVDQLSSIMEVKVQPRDRGGILVRTGDGMVLSGQGSAVLNYDTSGPTSVVSFTLPNGAQDQSAAEARRRRVERSAQHAQHRAAQYKGRAGRTGQRRRRRGQQGAQRLLQRAAADQPDRPHTGQPLATPRSTASPARPRWPSWIPPG